MSTRKRLWRMTAIACLTISTATFACTGMQLKAKDGGYVNGRTVEFATPLKLSVIFIPRNYAFNGTLPDGSNGIAYQSKYAIIGASTFGEPAVVDGINEKGLSSAAFYFPGYASYSPVTTENRNMALSPTEFVNWTLTQFATVDEVKNNLKNVVIAPTAPAGWGGTPPFHYVIYDKSGKSLVVEPIDGKLVAYENPIGVITNSPTFDWHLTNLSNYINLSPLNSPNKTIDTMKLNSFGMGSGLHGLPGDFSPPSRFVRSAIFSSSATPSNTADQSVLQAFHLLNQFDIPLGSVAAKENGKVSYDRTIATTVKDSKNLNYFYRTYDDQTIRMVSLKKFDPDSKQIASINMSGTQQIADMSSTAKPTIAS